VQRSNGAVIRERAGRDTLELLVLVGVLAALDAAGLTAGTPLWVYAGLAVLATTAITVAYARWPAVTGLPGLHCRLGLQVPAFLVLAYSTGWGPGLVMVLAFLIADAVKLSGSRAAWPALWWCVAGALVGQVGVQWEVAPSLIPPPGAHGLALLGILGLLLVTHRTARMAGEKEAAQDEAASVHHRFRSLVQHSSDVMLVIGVDNAISYISPSAEQVFGYRPDELRDRSFADLIHPDDHAEIQRFVVEVANQPGETSVVECRLRHADGGWRHIETVGNNLLHDPDMRGFVLNTRDVTERTRLEAQLKHRAFHDELTGLANRALFTDRVQHAVARQARREETVAVLFCDLDGFKTVNDTLGHGAGDELLVAVAERLGGCAREIDTVARLGGDEFAVLLEDQDDEQGARQVAGRILEAVAAPLTIRGVQVAVTTSIGIALCRGAGMAADDLLRNADIAMYMAKGAGKGRFELFEPSMHLAVVQRLQLESDLQHAVADEQFILHYQPIVELASRRIIGVEALVRWLHPERGLVPPGEFIPLAEATGLIVPIGRWVLHTACAQLGRWQQRFPSQPPLSINVNLSARQLLEPDLVQHVRGALASSGIEPSTLTLEMTESALVRETEATIASLTQLKALGIRLAIDDFGTGYSSLSYLQRFPIDTLKIDRSFIDSLERGDNPALLRAVVDLGHSLELETVAEGIERSDQVDQFRALRCQHGQGFYFARPGEETAIGELLAAQQPLASDRLPQAASRAS
jgi:diguanylate cyclase (GGDEF)-like protein/PAS domain S-box-containing protein